MERQLRWWDWDSSEQDPKGLLVGVANWDDILCIRLQGWLVVILVGESAVLLTDAEIKRQSPGGQANSYQDVAWISSMAEVEWEGSTKKTRTCQLLRCCQGRMGCKKRGTEPSLAPSLACEHLLGISSPNCPEWLKPRLRLGQKTDLAQKHGSSQGSSSWQFRYKQRNHFLFAGGSCLQKLWYF